VEDRLQKILNSEVGMRKWERWEDMKVRRWEDEKVRKSEGEKVRRSEGRKLDGKI
jgi:hypothetical protein